MKDIEDIIQVDDIGYVRKEDRAILRWSLWTSAIEWEAASRDVRKLGYDGGTVKEQGRIRINGKLMSEVQILRLYELYIHI